MTETWSTPPRSNVPQQLLVIRDTQPAHSCNTWHATRNSATLEGPYWAPELRRAAQPSSWRDDVRCFWRKSPADANFLMQLEHLSQVIISQSRHASEPQKGQMDDERRRRQRRVALCGLLCLCRCRRGRVTCEIAFCSTSCECVGLRVRGPVMFVLAEMVFQHVFFIFPHIVASNFWSALEGSKKKSVQTFVSITD